MIPVFLESPCNAADAESFQVNKEYCLAAMLDCLDQGESPYASHWIFAFSGALNDQDKEQRAQGMRAGFEWLRFANKSVVYIDLGLSAGMWKGIQKAIDRNMRIEWRSLKNYRPMVRGRAEFEDWLDGRVKKWRSHGPLILR